MKQDRFYRVSDVQRILGCGRDRAYQIMRSKGFPAITIGRQRYVSPEAFERWAQAYEGKEYVL